MAEMAEKEYIERGALLAEDFTDSFVDVYDVAIFEYIIESAPTADVVEVVRAEWIPSPDGINPIKCRRCGTVAPYRMELDFSHDIGLYPYKSNYCPNCGARMDGEWKEQDNDNNQT